MLIRSEMLLSGLFFLWGLCGIVAYHDNDYKMWLVSVVMLGIGAIGIGWNGRRDV